MQKNSGIIVIGSLNPKKGAGYSKNIIIQWYLSVFKSDRL